MLEQKVSKGTIGPDPQAPEPTCSWLKPVLWLDRFLLSLDLLGGWMEGEQVTMNELVSKLVSESANESASQQMSASSNESMSQQMNPSQQTSQLLSKWVN